MRAVVVYESMFGNTHHIADAVGTGLAPGFDVTVVPVSRADPEVLRDADLVVVGGPTHAHGMSRPVTRRGAAQMTAKPQSGQSLEPEALAPGLREWFAGLGTYHAKAAAFDTRAAGLAFFTGRASKGVGRALRRHGFDLAAKPESFLVTGQRLGPDEEDRAKAWAAHLASQLS